MSRRRTSKASLPPVETAIDSIAHDGRGVAHIDGKAVFIDGALPGETVRFCYRSRSRKFDTGTLEAVLTPSPDRVDPRCAHFGVCGGCSLQHLAEPRQIAVKQQALIENLRRIGKVEAEHILPPLTGPHWGYRRKARLGVKYVVKKGRVLVGFRERDNPYVADIERCEVLHPAVGAHIGALSVLITGLSARERIPQIEVAVGDVAAVLVFRHLDPLCEADKNALTAFGRAYGLHIQLQPGGVDSIIPLWPAETVLSYRLPAHDVELRFLPADFTQVNADINRLMVDHALQLLDVQPDERVLDLFCGLGNFTLPLARRAREAVGVEGEAGLVARARENAQRNGITNVTFHAENLAAVTAQASWLQTPYDKLLLDPPRTGAAEMIALLPHIGARRIVYVSCHPATLARDAGLLVHEQGYRLVSAGVMDMFPHTNHVESIAVFEA
jgi:23S rRNA (uracil1939-C5)-methyltransferase